MGGTLPTRESAEGATLPIRVSVCVLGGGGGTLPSRESAEGAILPTRESVCVYIYGGGGGGGICKLVRACVYMCLCLCVLGGGGGHFAVS